MFLKKLLQRKGPQGGPFLFQELFVEDPHERFALMGIFEKN